MDIDERFVSAKMLAIESIEAADDGRYEDAWTLAGMSNVLLLDVLTSLIHDVSSVVYDTDDGVVH